MCFGTVLLVEFLNCNCKVNDHIIINVALVVRRTCVKGTKSLKGIGGG